jgi:N utilization substance protein B
MIGSNHVDRNYQRSENGAGQGARPRLSSDRRYAKTVGAALSAIAGAPPKGPIAVRPAGKRAEKAKPKPRGSVKARRTAARLAAVQALYQIAQTGKSGADVVSEFVEFRIGHEVDGATFVPADITLLTAIVRGAEAERAALDAHIEAALRPPLERDRLELLLRAILAAGSWELLRHLEMPAAIVISEYVAVAGGFYGGPEPALINGVLDRLGLTGPGAIQGGPTPPGEAGGLENDV